MFRIKDSPPLDDLNRYKARFIAKGFTQKAGIDYYEKISPIIRYGTIRIMLALTAYLDLELEQMDVKTIPQW